MVKWKASDLAKKGLLVQGNEARRIRGGKLVTSGEKIAFIEQEAVSSDIPIAEKSQRAIFLPGNVPSSKNNLRPVHYKKKVDGKLKEIKAFTYSEHVLKYKEDISMEMLKMKEPFLELTKHNKFPLRITFTFVRSSKRTWDFQNAIQVLADLMKEYGWIPDDDSKFFLPFPPVNPPYSFLSRENPGVYIKPF